MSASPQQTSKSPPSPKYHTIVLVGSGCSGKSLLINHIMTKYDIGGCHEIAMLKDTKKKKYGIIITIPSHEFNTSKSQLPSDAIIVQITRQNVTSLKDIIPASNVHHTLTNNGTESEFLAAGMQLFEKIIQ